MKNKVFHVRAEGRGQRAEFVFLKLELTNYSSSHLSIVCYQTRSSLC